MATATPTETQTPAAPATPTAAGGGRADASAQWLKPKGEGPVIRPIPDHVGPAVDLDAAISAGRKGTKLTETADVDGGETAPAGQQASADQPSRQPEAQTATDEGAPVKPATDNIVPDEDGALAKALAGLTPAARKELTGVLTKKFMSAADARKEAEKIATELGTYKEVIQALHDDPAAALADLAEQHGYSLLPKESGTSVPAKATSTETQIAETHSKGILDAFAGIFGPEVAAQIAPAINQALLGVAREVIGKEVAPLKQTHNEIIARTAESEMNALTQSFKSKYSDFADLDTEMEALASVLHPAPGTDPAKFIEALYHTAKAQRGTTADEVVREITKATKTSEPPPRNVPEARTTPVPSGPVDFETAMSLAQQGIRVP